MDNECLQRVNVQKEAKKGIIRAFYNVQQTFTGSRGNVLTAPQELHEALGDVPLSLVYSILYKSSF